MIRRDTQKENEGDRTEGRDNIRNTVQMEGVVVKPSDHRPGALWALRTGTGATWPLATGESLILRVLMDQLNPCSSSCLKAVMRLPKPVPSLLVHPPTHLPFRPSVRPSIHPPTFPSTFLSVCLSVHLSLVFHHGARDCVGNTAPSCPSRSSQSCLETWV